MIQVISLMLGDLLERTFSAGTVFRTLSDKILKMSGQFHIMIGQDDRTSQPTHLKIFSSPCSRSIINILSNLSNILQVV